MEVSYRYIRLRLSEAGILPRSRMARVAWYLLGIDIALFALQKLLGLFHVSYGRSLAGRVIILSFVLIVRFAFFAFTSLTSSYACSDQSCSCDWGDGSALLMFSLASSRQFC